MDWRRALWVAVVLLFASLAVTAPVVIIRANVTPKALAVTKSQTTGQTKAVPVPAGTTGTVVMQRIAFNPSTLAVRKGATVLFDNRDVAPHTVTADAGDIDSGLLNPGRTFSLVVNSPLAYHCEVHANMRGRIVPEG
jgi:plastocyanin